MFGNKHATKAIEMLSNIQGELRTLCQTISRHESMLSSDNTLSLPNKISNHEGRLTALETRGNSGQLSIDRILLVFIAILGPIISLYIQPTKPNVNGHPPTKAIVESRNWVAKNTHPSTTC